MTVLALDIGGTELKGAVVAADGTVVRTVRRPTRPVRPARPARPNCGAGTALDAVLDCATELAELARRAGLRPRAAGVAAPGLVDEAAGTVVRAVNLDWHDVPIRDRLAEHLGLPIAFGHDVRAGGLAEARLGAGRGSHSFVFVPVGTGIAAAVLTGGRAMTGARGIAGELGHLVVRPGGERCACGGRGCLETVASAAAIARRHARLTGMTTSGAEDVHRRAVDGEAQAGQVWAEAVEALADGLAATVALLDPERIVIGGGLARAGDHLLAPLAAALTERLAFRTAPRLVAAELGRRAGCLGAALLAQDLLVGDPVAEGLLTEDPPAEDPLAEGLLATGRAAEALPPGGAP
ncbi:ROK family protein [Streptomyces sp. 1331.2]|uniref:ROK family protein n=1 Tax=Streptomyces sp. 1331.2 TaxID=1938835 RepID=UPI000BC920A8|nr:ROK family protein [Streptomyces sp. 1331.2]SOB79537.1 glucokinase [Streptomyces sp. 1331.2]